MPEIVAVKTKKVDGKWMVICPICGTEFEVKEPVGGYGIETCPKCGAKLAPY